MKKEIKSWTNGKSLFSCEAKDLKETVEKAVKSNIDLSFADLYMADLVGAKISGAHLSKANLFGSHLSHADLSCSDLSGSRLYNANLLCTNLSGANLREADLHNAILREAILYKTDFTIADLVGADFFGAHFGKTNFHAANLSKASFYNTDVSDADFYGTNLSETSFFKAKGIMPERFTPLLMLLDQPGKIRAYKLVKLNGEDIFAFSDGNNLKTIYEIGKEYIAKETDINPVIIPRIIVGTLDWALGEWREGFKILIVEFEAKDIIDIPTGKNYFYLHRCTVVGEKKI